MTMKEHDLASRARRMRQRGQTEGNGTLRIPVAAFQRNNGTMGCVRQAGMYVDPGTILWPYEFQGRRFTGTVLDVPRVRRASTI